jgi:hypothetical protein
MVRQALLLIVTVAVFGVLVPWLKGFAFLDPLMILCYACLGVLYVAPASAEAFGRESVAVRQAAIRKMLVLVGYGAGVSMLMTLSGILTVNFSNWHGSFIGPRPALLLAALLLSLTACAAVVAVTNIVASAYGPKAAKSMIRIAFLLFLLLLVFGYPRLSEDAKFQIELTLTTSGLTRLALESSAVLALVSASLTAWWISRVGSVPSRD